MEARHVEILKSITEQMMKDVYYPLSLCVWLDREGQILDLKQFDTHFCNPELKSPKGASECWLISNHADGKLYPYHEDLCNRIQAAASCRGRICRLYLYLADEGIIDRSKW